MPHSTACSWAITPCCLAANAARACLLNCAPLGMGAGSSGALTLEQARGRDQEALHVARLELGQATGIEAALAGRHRRAEVGGEAVQCRRRQWVPGIEAMR